MGRFALQPEQRSDPVELPSPLIAIGERCRILDGPGSPERRGTVRFFGATKFGKDASPWVGIELDEPLGKNNGMCVLH